MKFLTVLFLAALVWNVAAQSTAEDSDSSAYDYNLTGEGVDLHFKVMKEPIFPLSLKNKGVSQGEVMVQLDIDHHGELRDWLVTRATHKDFADAVDRAVAQWKFGPPHWNGKAISVVCGIKVNFHASGSVVSLDVSSGLADVYMSAAGISSFDSIKLAKFDDLDIFPEPIKIVDPVVPRKLVNKHGNNVGVFRFYIDTEGRVRLPRLERVEGKVDVRLLEAAQDALEQWRFTPPTSKGRKVVVEVVQPFLFNPSKNER